MYVLLWVYIYICGVTSSMEIYDIHKGVLSLAVYVCIKLCMYEYVCMYYYGCICGVTSSMDIFLDTMTVIRCDTLHA